MDVMNDEGLIEQISNNDEKSIYENGDIGLSSLKQKSLFTISGVIFCCILKRKTNILKELFIDKFQCQCYAICVTT